MSNNVIIHLNGPYNNDPNDATVRRFKVGRVTNTLDYSPGMFLHENEVRSLCANVAYTVHIDPIPGSK